jgi:uncharacterized iron-regulated protein
MMGQENTPKHNIFTANGEPATMDDILAAAARSDVLFLGELHDDAVGHAFQFEVFQRAVNEIGAKRPVTLSLEMFERDVQIVLDEYLRGQITEDHFLRSSRPWGNYKTDYRPLVELAKEKKLPVIAANAPRRYVNMVSRSGRDALNTLSPEAKSWLAPLPYAEASEAYSNKFKALMGSSMEARMGLDNILSSQSLWDATMAFWISEGLKTQEQGLIVHLNGGFHTEQRLGTVEHLARYRPDARATVVTIRYEEAFDTFNKEKHTGLGDFVVLTDASAPRSKR